MAGQRRPELRIDLLGGFRVAVGSQSIADGAWRLRKARTLLKLLALSPEHRAHREQVIDTLWPDGDRGAGSNNLRQAVYVCRRALDSCGDDGARRLELAQDVFALSPEGLVVDVINFERAAEAARRTVTIESLTVALDLYGGELLPEDRFEQWVAPRRDELRERHLALLVDLARMTAETGRSEDAIAALQHALTDDPFSERVHRELMVVYARSGRRQRALAQFHVLRDSLKREFEDEPEEATRRLYRELLARRDGQGNTAAEPTPRAEPRGHQLPLSLTSFVGRQRELEEVVDLSHRHRLVTLTGPGGCGKTRLALEAASRLADDAPDGVWLTHLAGLTDATLVAGAVATALGVESRSGRPSEQALAAHLGDAHALLIIDNCEHVIIACAQLAEHLLTDCRNVRLLLTSREPLRAAGEVNWRVPSLAPDDAVRLFAERAATTSSRFDATADNADAIHEICRRLDGIPLAIELAAARVNVLTPAQIAERLSRSLSVLASAGRGALSRQQTLVATLDWSHDLLDPEEQTLLRRLAAFAGRFDLDSVEIVCDGTLDVLARLVDKSLVVVDEQDEVARYRLLDTVRHYSRERLARSGEGQNIAARHRAHYLALAESLEPLADRVTTNARLELDADEVRLAMRTALDEEPGIALRLAAALWRFWHDRGERTEGVGWLEAALRANPDPSGVRAQVLHGLSVLAMRTNRHERTVATAHEALAHYRSVGSKRELAEELHHVGTLAWVFVDFSGAVHHLEESRALAEEEGDHAVVASVLHTLGVLEASRSRTAEGRRLIGESVAQLRRLPPVSAPLLLPVALGYGRNPRDQERPHRRFLEHTFVTARRVEPISAVAYALADEAAAARDADDLEGSRLLVTESLSLFRSVDDVLGIAQTLGQLGNLASVCGEHESARRLHEESLALREQANDARGIGLSRLAMSVAAGNAGELGRAGTEAERALGVFERSDDGPGRAAATMQLGYLAADEGRLEAASEWQERALAMWRGFIPLTGWTSAILLELAMLDTELGRAERVSARVRAALQAYERVGDLVGAARCRELLGTPSTAG